MPLTVSSLVGPGQVDGPCGNLVIIRGDEAALPGVDDLVRLGRVGGNLKAVPQAGREKKRAWVSIQNHIPRSQILKRDLTRAASVSIHHERRTEPSRAAAVWRRRLLVHPRQTQTLANRRSAKEAHYSRIRQHCVFLYTCVRVASRAGHARRFHTTASFFPHNPRSDSISQPRLFELTERARPQRLSERPSQKSERP